jgi:glycosyltransferase involved in cell wall biosynthesis
LIDFRRRAKVAQGQGVIFMDDAGGSPGRLRPAVAVFIACHNEAPTIGKVVRDFRKALPHAEIYVCDNLSTDGTATAAAAAGATVLHEPLKGKGHVVRRMFADIDADIYVMVDGDDTYEAADAPRMVRALIEGGLDMVNGARNCASPSAFRRGHRLGNRILTAMIAQIFGNRIGDMLSGYKVFSRRFVKSFPALSAGFETETELTVHALELHMRVAEVPTDYRERPEGMNSKLRTVRDGLRILRTIVKLLKEERPLQFFSVGFTILAATSLILGWSILMEFIATGLVPRLPTAVLATGLMLLAFLSLACGLILDTVTVGRRELKRLHFLQMPTVAARDARPADQDAVWIREHVE